MSGIAPIPDEPLRCSEPPLWAMSDFLHCIKNSELFSVGGHCADAGVC